MLELRSSGSQMCLRVGIRFKDVALRISKDDGFKKLEPDELH
jgi:hypothetical protein